VLYSNCIKCFSFSFTFIIWLNISKVILRRKNRFVSCNPTFLVAYQQLLYVCILCSIHIIMRPTILNSTNSNWSRVVDYVAKFFSVYIHRRVSRAISVKNPEVQWIDFFRYVIMCHYYIYILYYTCIYRVVYNRLQTNRYFSSISN
jgi:hypothetical protein